MRKIVGNGEEYFWGKREHGAQFLGTWELRKREFRGTVNFHREQGNVHQAPPREALYIRQDTRELLNFLKTNPHF